MKNVEVTIEYLYYHPTIPSYLVVTSDKKTINKILKDFNILTYALS